ncbi:MAG TPA: 2-amino-4-hydroxy-6-hydroxymethyldihydropteridine diphosphokinase [Alcanivoracaceae bacterium]|nr:2-amino-4-hydroxy-6-hydroxymethyldihydropteridine diphosphokinase [Alcanivoracaceae bacterium]
MADPTRVYLSLGSNINREHNITSGLDALAKQFGEVSISPVYESESVGFDGSPFYNLVAVIYTTMGVGELVDTLHDIEADHGRTRQEKKFASRTLDIDVLTYGDVTGVVDGVELPRDEILHHAFVLKPLVDVAANERHPVEGATYAELLQQRDFSAQKLWPISLQWPN